jgi:hypothetical protein
LLIAPILSRACLAAPRAHDKRAPRGAKTYRLGNHIETPLAVISDAPGGVINF